VARILVRDTDSSRELVAAGLACHYTQYSSDPVLARAQVAARQSGRGFWLPNAQKPRCAGTAPSGESDPTARARDGTVMFHGNTSSRVYHAPFCPNYNCRNGTRPFASAQEAQAAGFRPAGDCLGENQIR
jgi:hypothetical protein